MFYKKDDDIPSCSGIKPLQHIFSPIFLGIKTFMFHGFMVLTYEIWIYFGRLPPTQDSKKTTRMTTYIFRIGNLKKKPSLRHMFSIVYPENEQQVAPEK